MNTGYPIHITVDSLDRILVGPIPNDIYTIQGDYWLSGQVLAVDADLPDMPADFHDLVVWYAMEHYGYHQLAPEVIERAMKFSRRMMRQLEINQLPRMKVAGALA